MSGNSFRAIWTKNANKGGSWRELIAASRFEGRHRQTHGEVACSLLRVVFAAGNNQSSDAIREGAQPGLNPGLSPGRGDLSSLLPVRY